MSSLQEQIAEAILPQLNYHDLVMRDSRLADDKAKAARYAQAVLASIQPLLLEKDAEIHDLKAGDAWSEDDCKKYRARIKQLEDALRLLLRNSSVSEHQRLIITEALSVSEER